MQTIEPVDFKRFQTELKNGSEAAEKVFKEHVFTLGLDVLIDIHLTKDSSGYLFEDSVSDLYLFAEATNKAIPINAKNILELNFFLINIIKRHFESFFARYIDTNLDVAKMSLEDNILVRNKDWAEADYEGINHNLFVEDLKNELLKAIETLKPKEQTYIKMYYGLSEDGSKPMSTPQIAKVFNLSTEAVSRHLRKAHRKMRHPYRSNKFREYADGI